ncbi:MAG: deoxyribonuclease IV [Planctomycetaceae bacterium]
MPLFGSHLSIAGGYHKAADAAGALGMQTVQIFTKNNNQWQGKPLTDDDVRLFKASVERQGLRIPCSHDSYLINLGSPDDELWAKSLEAFVVELERAEALGLAGVVMHPGSYLASTEEAGLTRIVRGLDESLRRTAGCAVEIWIETTAGQGTNLGHRFEHLQHLFEHVHDDRRMGVCVDSCHIFAAGYPLATDEEYAATFDEFDERVGLDRIRAFHLNDSRKPLGSRVDRHDHIGEGVMGLEPFRHIVNDPRFDALPMYLETKKEDRDGEPMDAVNLRTLRSLLKPRGGKRTKPRI